MNGPHESRRSLLIRRPRSYGLSPEARSMFSVLSIVLLLMGLLWPSLAQGQSKASDKDLVSEWEEESDQGLAADQEPRDKCRCRISLATVEYLAAPAGADVGGEWAFRTRVRCGRAKDTTIHALCLAPIPLAQGGVHVFNTLLVDQFIGKKGKPVNIELGADARECDGQMGAGPPFNDNGSANVALGPFTCTGVNFLVERLVVPVAEFGGEDAPAGNIGRMEFTFEILIDP